MSHPNNTLAEVAAPPVGADLANAHAPADHAHADHVHANHAPGPHGFCEWTFCIICMIVMAPFYCFYLLFAAVIRILWRVLVNYRNQTAKLILTRKVKPLDPERRNSISFEMIDFKAKQEPIDQSGSHFVSRLPPELRLMIYEHVLGGQNFHIIHGRKRMMAVPCTETYNLTHYERSIANRAFYEASTFFKRSDTYTRSLPRRWNEPSRQRKFHMPCIEPFIDRKTLLAKNKANKFPMKGKRFTDRLALLKTCKLVYIEAIDLLYSRNKFYFHHPADLALWTDTIPQSRLSKVTSLDFLLCGSVPPRPRFRSEDMSAKVFPVLRQMLSLKRIRIVPSVKWEDSPIVYALLTFELEQRDNPDRHNIVIQVDWMPGGTDSMV